MGSVSAEVSRYGWISRSPIRDAACLTLVHEADTTLVARSFGADPEQGRNWSFEEFCEEAFACAERQSLIGLRTVGEWTLVAEESRFEGVRHDVLESASAGTEAVAIHWDLDRATTFSHAVHGAVRTSFEAVLPEYRTGTRPDDLEVVRAGLPWHESEEVPLVLALAARVTGCELMPHWFAGQFLTCPVKSCEGLTTTGYPGATGDSGRARPVGNPRGWRA
ncbi:MULTISPECIES: DUF6461 domain-containing protein [unclassified Actinopolyspora]|uniref:DUF6461 domain-containing protein n=1 Tax=Actinopolyspora TaxID=1849 RepID=UPI0013F63BBF|nr:hypothetical protein [Actinopolyspora sp. BKK2]NHE78725.1 hypothetical protein [Actinopolyspora sp. BKK1]